MKLKRLKIIVLLITLFSTYNVYAAETGSVESGAQTPQEAEALNKNKTILMGVDLDFSTDYASQYIDRHLVQVKLSYRYFFYPNKLRDKVKNGICLDFGFLYSTQTLSAEPEIGKAKALYFNSSVLYSLNSYRISVYHNLLFNIGLTANFFLSKIMTGGINDLWYPNYSMYSYRFAQVGILMEISYLVYSKNFKRAFVTGFIFKVLTDDLTPRFTTDGKYPKYSKLSFYFGVNYSLFFNSN